ncbi:iron ABC transporter permease [uncultured Rikenella sp.]|uniref:iron ABC transporter permease n=1 Tax=uncultured Rikenella sp. TaxID=368003 RepID=UPI0025D77D75|nr:iron ABC transporter permease [uncultured Rikenella sp.]
MKLKFILLGVLLVGLFGADVTVGSTGLVWPFGAGDDEVMRRILFDFRLPKTIVALLVGSALAVSGLLMQTVFRNPLAGPYVLGVSSGASLGVALFLLGAPVIGGLGMARDLGMAVAAWSGAAAILVVVMVVSARIRDMMAVLILGMMFGSGAAALVDLLQYFSSDSALKGFVIWSMGSLGGLSPAQVLILALCVGGGILLSVLSVKPLNLLLLGEGYARSMGVSIRRVRTVIFVATSLLAGGVTAFCGPIGFVGIAVPHLARMFFRRADHRILLPASMLIGADLMLLCDMLSQLPGTDLILPVNTLTALVGIPVVVAVVVNNKRGRMM